MPHTGRYEDRLGDVLDEVGHCPVVIASSSDLVTRDRVTGVAATEPPCRNNNQSMLRT